MKPSCLKKCWSIDRRVYEANAHKLPSSEGPQTPTYLKLTCAALLKKKSFKVKSLKAAKNKQKAARRICREFVDAAAAVNEVVEAVETLDMKADGEPESASWRAPEVPCLEMSEVPLRSLVRSWTVRDQKQSGSSNPAAGSCIDVVDIKATDDGKESNKASPACEASHPAIVEFKKLLANLRGERPKSIADLGESLEILWSKGNIADLGNYDRLWSIIVDHPDIDLEQFLLNQIV